jgi:hypothetical protein
VLVCVRSHLSLIDEVPKQAVEGEAQAVPPRICTIGDWPGQVPPGELATGHSRCTEFLL